MCVVTPCEYHRTIRAITHIRRSFLLVRGTQLLPVKYLNGRQRGNEPLIPARKIVLLERIYKISDLVASSRDRFEVLSFGQEEGGEIE